PTTGPSIGFTGRRLRSSAPGRRLNKLNEVANYSADALEQMNAIYDQLNQSKGLSWGAGSYSTPFTWSPGSGDYDTAESNRANLMSSLEAAARGRQQYDNLVSQFNAVYS